MIVSIMQPYFFPYIGYFQLMAACDLFVVFDDAQYINRGWVNRNRILIDGSPQWITMPVATASHDLPILQRQYLPQDRMATRLPQRISGAYRPSPHFVGTMRLVEEILAFPQANVADFNINLLRKLSAHLGIDTPIVRTSEMNKDDTFVGGERRVIDICSRLGATAYVNPIGGRTLYSGESFASNGIDLCFLSCEAPPYPQFGSIFVPALSIIDVLMFNDIPAIGRMLREYRLLPASHEV
jgi:hypothetical protein